MARLIVFDDQVRGVDLPGGTVIIGRSKKSDVPIRDTILSRKHCAIVSTESSYRIVDLKSSNGTFLNGSPVERASLSYDDVIEIGNTVMVFVESEVWSRGEGLARLRNPVKAQELVQRIRLHSEKKKRIPVRRVPSRKKGAERSRDLIRSVPLFDPDQSDAAGERMLPDAFADMLEDFCVYKTMSLLLRNRPELRRAVTESIESALISVVSGGWSELRPKLREELSKRFDVLERAKKRDLGGGAGSRSEGRTPTRGEEEGRTASSNDLSEDASDQASPPSESAASG